MKLTSGLIAALVGGVAAASQVANVYQITSQQSTSTSSLSPTLARLVLLQRLASPQNGPSLSDLPEGTKLEEAIEALTKFGKTVQPLFASGVERKAGEPSQLVVMLEDMTPKQLKEVGKALKMTPAFAIQDPPPTSAHNDLLELDFYNAGVTNQHQCTIDQVANPLEEECWSGKSTVAKYNVKKNPDVIKSLINAASRLQKLSKSHEMETTIVLLPESQNGSKQKSWSDKTKELRRRQEAEQVISAFDKSDKPATPTSSAKKGASLASVKTIQSCYDSQDSCIAATGNCSHHGLCYNKYAPNSDEDEDDSGKNKGGDKCWTCTCLSTKLDSGSVQHWGGATCAKQDVSVPFWLFAGFTIVMVGVVSMAISLLYSVGEEKLPGVIGAGVSRTK